MVNDIPTPSKAKQRASLLEALMESSGITTYGARTYHNVMHPAGRIAELRAQGYCIETQMGWFSDSDGNLHRMAKYVLRVQEQA